MSDSRSRAWDYIIVGSGAAGSVLADRLSADGRSRVLVLEAGDTDRGLTHLLPFAFGRTSADRRYTKKYPSLTPEETWVQGRILGGSTTINGMIWNRGLGSAYDDLAELGNPGWDASAFQRAFGELERRERGTRGTPGGEGPLPITIAGPADAVSDALIASLDQHGVTRVPDVNTHDGERVGYAQRTISRGLRVSAARAFLNRARKRPNVRILTGVTVSAIDFEGVRATGVIAESAGEKLRFAARGEVLVCAGALESPLLLERSGVGNPDVLASGGVPLRIASPKVGENLRQHRGLVVTFRLRAGLGYNHQLSTLTGQLGTMWQYLTTRQGVASLGGAALMGVLRSGAGGTAPDTQLFFAPLSAGEREPGATLGLMPITPTSTGSVHCTGSAADRLPIITKNYFSTEPDRRVLTQALARVREVVATGPFAAMVREELLPDAAVPTAIQPETVVRLAREAGFTGNHAIGTCAMGPDEDDVVDAALRVRGSQGLRVVDASVFPHHTSGNTAAPTVALAWLAAERILGGR